MRTSFLVASGTESKQFWDLSSWKANFNYSSAVVFLSSRNIKWLGCFSLNQRWKIQATDVWQSAQIPLRYSEVTVEGFHVVARICVPTGLIPRPGDCSGRAHWRPDDVAQQGALPVLGSEHKQRFLQASAQAKDAVVRQGRILPSLLQLHFPNRGVIYVFIAIPVCAHFGICRKKCMSLTL